MNVLQRLGRWVTDQRAARRLGEDDAPADTGVAYSRDAGGVGSSETQDSNSTTGTTPSGSFVGRASGDESGDVGPSGGERRAGETSLDDQGAARDE